MRAGISPAETELLLTYADTISAVSSMKCPALVVSGIARCPQLSAVSSVDVENCSRTTTRAGRQQPNRRLNRTDNYYPLLSHARSTRRSILRTPCIVRACSRRYKEPASIDPNQRQRPQCSSPDLPHAAANAAGAMG